MDNFTKTKVDDWMQYENFSLLQIGDTKKRQSILLYTLCFT